MITLVLGGSRSGKSEVAEALASRLSPPVTFVATGQRTDPDMAERIEAHRARRPSRWRTVELAPGEDLVGLLGELSGTALVDSLGTWLAGQESFVVDGEGLCAELVAREGDTVVVTDEVGLGVHPSSAAGREFRDALGALNWLVAEAADETLLVVAGRVLRLEAI